MAFGHLLAAELKCDEAGNALSGSSLLQWGSQALHKLYPDQAAPQCENRFIAPPEKAHEWRRILTESVSATGTREGFLRGHLVPIARNGRSFAPSDVLEHRRIRIRELEKTVVERSGLRYSSDEG